MSPGVEIREAVDYSHLDAKESQKEKKIKEFVENADSPVAQQEAANKLNEHFNFMGIANDLKKSFPSDAVLTSEDVTKFIKDRLPNEAHQEDFWQSFALWLSTEEHIIVDTKKYDCSGIPVGNHPMAGTQAAGEFMLRVLAGDMNGVDASRVSEVWLPKVTPRSSQDIHLSRSVNGAARFNKSIQVINDISGALKRTSGDKNKELQNQKSERESHMQKQLDTLANGVYGLLQQDPRALNKQTQQLVEEFNKAKQTYANYLQSYEVDTNWNQMRQYDERIKETSNKIYSIQLVAREKHMEQVYLGDYNQALQNITKTWVHNDFVPLKGEIKRPALERAMVNGIPKFIDQYTQKNGLDATLNLLDDVQKSVDANNWQSENLQNFYKVFATVLQQSVIAQVVEQGNRESEIKLFKLLTGRSLENPSGQQSFVEWMNTEGKIDDGWMNYDGADLLDAKMLSDSEIFDHIAQQEQNRQALGFLSQEEFGSLQASLPSFTAQTPDGQTHQYDIFAQMGIDRQADITMLSFEQQKMLRIIKETSLHADLAQLWPHTNQVNLQQFFATMEKVAERVDEDTMATSIDLLGTVNVASLSPLDQELYALSADYNGIGWADLSDKSIQNLKSKMKLVAKVGAVAIVAAATSGSGLPFLSSAIITGVAGAAIEVGVDMKGFDSSAEGAKFFGFGALQSVVLGGFSKIPAIRRIGLPLDETVSGSIKQLGLANRLKTVGVQKVKAKANTAIQGMFQKPVKNVLGEAQQALVFEEGFDIDAAIGNIFTKLGSNAGMEILVQMALDADDPEVVGMIADKLEQEAAVIIPQYRQALQQATTSEEREALQTMLEHREFAGAIKTRMQSVSSG